MSSCAGDSQRGWRSQDIEEFCAGGVAIVQRGSKGGYKLARKPGAISVAEMIGAIEGYPMGLTECSSIPGLCTRESSCSVRTNWQRKSDVTRLQLGLF